MRVWCSQETRSLDVPLNEQEESPLWDFIEDQAMLDPANCVSHQSLKACVEDALKGLTRQEYRVLHLRYGLYDGRHRTLNEVGKVLGVSVSARSRRRLCKSYKSKPELEAERLLVARTFRLVLFLPSMRTSFRSQPQLSFFTGSVNTKALCLLWMSWKTWQLLLLSFLSS